MIFATPVLTRDYFSKKTGSEYGIGLWNKIILFIKFRKNIKRVSCASSFLEHLKMATAILNIPKNLEGVVVECGAYKGGSTVNLSLLCSACGRRLKVFDSFEGLPDPEQEDKAHLVFGSREIHAYSKGAFKGVLEEVKENVKKYGDLSVCDFYKGYFKDTMPQFKEKCVFVFEDADLKESIEDCLKNLWPLLGDGCYFYTHEAQHLETASLFFDNEWWNKNLNSKAPGLVGAGNGLGISVDGDFFGGSTGYAIKNPEKSSFTEKPQDSQLLVSIITPTFNRGEFLEKNILSIKNQNYKNIEHIVTDGGSTDNSLDILKKYEGTYNLKWVSEKDNGCANAMNKGFKMASGDIFCWLDADDYYLPGTLEKVVKIFQNNPNVDVVFGDIFVCNANGKIIDFIRHTDFSADTAIYEGMNVSTQAIFWRKKVHNMLDQLDEKYLRCADYDFFVRMGLLGVKFFHSRDFLSVYRHHKGQISRSVKLRQSEEKTIVEKYKDRNLSRFGLRLKKVQALLRRGLHLIKQGDIYYVLRGILRRTGIIKKYE